MTTTGTSSPRARALAHLVVPAAVVGAVSAILLIVLSVLAERLQDVLWETLPEHLDVGAGSAGWILLILTATGVTVGLIVWLVPGHAGPDPATQSMVSPPVPPMVLPSLALTAIAGLAGGVSLGPENPIIAINVGLAVWLGRRVMAGVPLPQWVGFAAAGTIGAMFGTPVGAALVLSEAPAAGNAAPFWDRVFAPLVAAATGSLVMVAFGQPAFAVAVEPYRGARWPDLLSGPAIAVVAAIIGLVLVYAFPVVHDAFVRVRQPLVMLTLGGMVLGVLGAIGGKITLFKGLDEMKELVATTHSDGRLVVIIAVKLAAILIAASCGFRGGRVFPAVFAGVAIGLLASQLVDSIPPSLAIAAAVVGMMLVVTRSGWLSLFMAIATVGEIDLLPILCIALLPAWLLVTDRPQLEIDAPSPTPADIARLGKAT